MRQALETSRRVTMNLEVVVIPSRNLDRAKEFYLRLGWRLDADRAGGPPKERSPDAETEVWTVFCHSFSECVDELSLHR
jgi:catechol 2,3-dioxygenase-like lactoylglutathione lyase family enzyme